MVLYYERDPWVCQVEAVTAAAGGGSEIWSESFRRSLWYAAFPLELGYGFTVELKWGGIAG